VKGGKAMLKPRLIVACCVLWIASTVTGAAQPAFQIIAPRDYQVVQRQTRLNGTIVLRGVMKDPRSVEFRLLGSALEGKLPDWQEIEVEGDAGAYEARLPAPAGGWYRLEVRVGNDTAVVEHVGVGEVFVVAGQSNSTNYGSKKQKPLSGRVASFDGDKWALADDPQPGVFDRSKGGSASLRLGMRW